MVATSPGGLVDNGAPFWDEFDRRFAGVGAAVGAAVGALVAVVGGVWWGRVQNAG